MLAKQFGISRNCLREALKALEVIGVIDIRAGRGAFIRGDAVDNIKKY